MKDEFEYAIQCKVEGYFPEEWEVQCTYDSSSGVEHDFYLQLDQRKRDGRSRDDIRMVKRLKTDWEPIDA